MKVFLKIIMFSSLLISCLPKADEELQKLELENDNQIVSGDQLNRACNPGAESKISCVASNASVGYIPLRCNDEGTEWIAISEVCSATVTPIPEVLGQPAVNEKQVVMYSYSANRSNALPLSGASLDRRQVYFFLDNDTAYSSSSFYCCKLLDGSEDHGVSVEDNSRPFIHSVNFTNLKGGERELYFDISKSSGGYDTYSTNFTLRASDVVVDLPVDPVDPPIDIPLPDLDPVSGDLIFRDSFETGDFSAPDSSDGFLNKAGFRWSNTYRTSIVTMDPLSVVINNGSPIRNESAPDRDWNARSGDNSLRFRYPAGEPFAEQRFDMGAAQRDFWFSYWVRVPPNYYHVTSGGAVNNKFFSIWTDGYSQAGDGSTFWLSMESAGSGNTNLSFTYSHGGNTTSVSMQQHAPFINHLTDRNRWMEVVVHLKTESSDNADDGVIETWRRWRDETSFTKLHEKLDAPLRIPPGGPQGFKTGYLLGWANGEYTEDTEWLLDDVKISNSKEAIMSVFN